MPCSSLVAHCLFLPARHSEEVGGYSGEISCNSKISYPPPPKINYCALILIKRAWFPAPFNSTQWGLALTQTFKPAVFYIRCNVRNITVATQQLTIKCEMLTYSSVRDAYSRVQSVYFFCKRSKWLICFFLFAKTVNDSFSVFAKEVNDLFGMLALLVLQKTERPAQFLSSNTKQVVSFLSSNTK